MTRSDVQSYFSSYLAIAQRILDEYDATIPKFDDQLIDLQSIVPLMQGYVLDYWKTSKHMFLDALNEERANYSEVLLHMRAKVRETRKHGASIEAHIASLRNITFENPETAGPIASHYLGIARKLNHNLVTYLNTFETDTIDHQYQHMLHISDLIIQIRSFTEAELKEWGKSARGNFKESRELMKKAKEQRKLLDKHIEKVQILATGDVQQARQVLSQTADPGTAPA